MQIFITIRNFFSFKSLSTLATLGITCYLFLPILNNSFVEWDTPFYITSNPYIQSITFENVKKLCQIYIYWMPLTWFSYLFDSYFFNLEPWGIHLHNLVLHILNTSLVLLLLKKICHLTKIDTKNKRTWLIICLFTLLWAIHPMRVEAVAWAANRKGLLSSFFMLISILSYLHLKKSNSIKIHVLTSIFGICAYASHPNAITLPVILLCLDHTPLKRYSIFKKKYNYPLNIWLKETLFFSLQKAPLILFGFLTAFLAFKGQSNLLSIQSFDLKTKTMNCIYQLIFYLKQHITLWESLPIYPQLNIKPFSAILLFGSFLIILSFIYALKYRCQKPELLTCICIYFVTLAPTLGLIQAGWITHADRWSYLAIIPIIVLICGWSLNKEKTKYVPIILTIMLFTYIPFIKDQLDFWKNNQHFFQKLSERTNNQKHPFHIYLGKSYIDNNHLDQAKQLLSINLSHQNYMWKHIALYLLGNLEIKSDTNKAISYFQQSIKQNPSYLHSYIALSSAYIDNKQHFKSDATLQKLSLYSQKLSPNQNYEIYNLKNINYIIDKHDAINLLETNKPILSLDKWEQIKTKYPFSKEAYFWISLINLKQNNTNQAIANFNTYKNWLSKQPMILFNINRQLSQLSKFKPSLINKSKLLSNWTNTLKKLSNKPQSNYIH